MRNYEPRSQCHERWKCNNETNAVSVPSSMHGWRRPISTKPQHSNVSRQLGCLQARRCRHMFVPTTSAFATRDRKTQFKSGWRRAMFENSVKLNQVQNCLQFWTRVLRMNYPTRWRLTPLPTTELQTLHRCERSTVSPLWRDWQPPATSCRPTPGIWATLVDREVYTW